MCRHIVIVHHLFLATNNEMYDYNYKFGQVDKTMSLANLLVLLKNIESFLYTNQKAICLTQETLKRQSLEEKVFNSPLFISKVS